VVAWGASNKWKAFMESVWKPKFRPSQYEKAFEYQEILFFRLVVPTAYKVGSYGLPKTVVFPLSFQEWLGFSCIFEC
jgi:hypothetical protein